MLNINLQKVPRECKDKKISRNAMEWLLISMSRFRSAVCQIDLLRRSATLAEDGIREALHSTPKDLDKTYEQIFEVMANEAPVLTRSVLRWIEFNMH